MLASELVAAVQGEGVSATDALRVINECYVEANARARWNRTTAALGTTVANQPNYNLDTNTVDLDLLRIGTAEYWPVSQEIIWGLQSGRLTRSGDGVFAADYSTAGVAQIEFYPAPATTGTTIETLQVARPALLTTTPDSTPVFPEDLHGPLLIDGPLGKIRARSDERMISAREFKAIYDQAIGELALRANRRVGGFRPRQALLIGRDF